MLTFHRIRLVSTSLAGATRHRDTRYLATGDRVLVMSEIIDRAAVSTSDELAHMAQQWLQDGGQGYLKPIMADLAGTFFAGYIDTIAGSVTLQRERIYHLEQAMGFAIWAAMLRSNTDRSCNHLPSLVLPLAENLGPLLDASTAAPRMGQEPLRSQGQSKGPMLATADQMREAVAA